jgi:four helix bundle protein
VAIRGFKDLDAWKEAMQLCRLVYAITKSLPKEERFGLTSQMRRAAVSVPSNLAEGHSRRTRGEFLQFIGHARGSLAELETQTILCCELGLLTSAATAPVIEHIARLRRIIDGLRAALAPEPGKKSNIHDPDPRPPTPSGNVDV